MTSHVRAPRAKGLLGAQVPLRGHGARGDAGRRLHGRHARADGHDPADVRQPVRRRLPGHRRRGPGEGGLRGPARQPACSGAGSTPRWSTRYAGSTAWRRPRATSAATPASSARTGKALGNPATGAPTIGLNWTDERGAQHVHPRLRARHQRATTRSSSTARARGTAVSASATRRRCWCRAAAAGPDRRHRPLRQRRQPRRGHDRRLQARRGAAARSASRASTTRVACSPQPGVSADRAGRAGCRAVLPARHRGADGRRDHRGDAGARSAKAFRFFNTFMLIFAVIALLVGALHDLQHVLDHGRPADPGERAAAGARGQPAAGARRRCCSRRSPSGSWPSVAGDRRRLRRRARPQGPARRRRAGHPDRQRRVHAGHRGHLLRRRRRGHGPGRAVAGPQGGEGPADRGHAGRRHGQHRLRVEAAGDRRRRRCSASAWPRCCSGCSRDVEQPMAVVGAGALLVFFGVSILGRTISLPLSRVIGRTAATAAGHHRRARPGERDAQPEAHGRQRVRAHDRRRASSASSPSSCPRPRRPWTLPWTGRSPATSWSTPAAGSYGGVDPGWPSASTGSPRSPPRRACGRAWPRSPAAPCSCRPPTRGRRSS